MANLKIKTPKLHYKDKQDWITPDEVYLAILVVNGNDVTNDNVEEQVNGEFTINFHPHL